MQNQQYSYLPQSLNFGGSQRPIPHRSPTRGKILPIQFHIWCAFSLPNFIFISAYCIVSACAASATHCKLDSVRKFLGFPHQCRLSQINRKFGMWQWTYRMVLIQNITLISASCCPYSSWSSKFDWILNIWELPSHPFTDWGQLGKHTCSFRFHVKFHVDKCIAPWRQGTANMTKFWNLGAPMPIPFTSHGENCCAVPHHIPPWSVQCVTPEGQKP